MPLCQASRSWQHNRFFRTEGKGLRTEFVAFAYALAGLIGFSGYSARALTWDGAVAACLVGGTVFGFGGLGCAVLLVIFFASSSLLSFVGMENRTKQRAAETFEKGGRRDAAQVLANGGVAAILALLIGLLGNEAIPVLFGAFVGGLAAATADTWATEIGVLNRGEPRLITTGKVVEVGTSGGVTWLGSGAALLGAGIIGGAATLLSLFAIFSIPRAVTPFIFVASLVGGTAGMLADSLLGATIQASYHCPKCGKPTESRVHRCGTPTELQRGLVWVNNDLVNAAGSMVGALVGGAVMFFCV